MRAKYRPITSSQVPSDPKAECAGMRFYRKEISPTPPCPISSIPPKKENQKVIENEAVCLSQSSHGSGLKTGAGRDVVEKQFQDVVAARRFVAYDMRRVSIDEG